EMQIAVSGAAGAVATQTQVLERWPDGSIRWALLDFQADAPRPYDVLLESGLGSAEGLIPRHGEGVAEIVSGGCRFRVGLAGQFRLEVSNEGQRTPSRIIRLELTRSNGMMSHADVSSVEWETSGPLRAVLR